MKLHVALNHDPYDIIIEPDLLSRLADIVAPWIKSKVVVLTNPVIYGKWGERIASSFKSYGVSPIVIMVPAGERSKRLSTAERICNTMALNRCDRNTLMINAGGGVIGDLGGFVASAYMRGIPFVQVPTSLLAQVDAAVGGKVAVDIKAGKNLVGAFKQPVCVAIDPNTLNTLPIRQLRNGMAEVIKCAVALSSDLYNYLSEMLTSDLIYNPSFMTRIIHDSCRIKADIVAQDELDITGIRAKLNYGHTVAHALEQACGYQKVLHGEAVSIGMIAAAKISMKRYGLTADIVEPTERLLRIAKLPVRLPKHIDPDSLISGLYRDKKSSNGKLNFVLSNQIGNCELIEDISEELVRETLNELRQ